MCPLCLECSNYISAVTVLLADSERKGLSGTKWFCSGFLFFLFFLLFCCQLLKFLISVVKKKLEYIALFCCDQGRSMVGEKDLQGLHSYSCSK